MKKIIIIFALINVFFIASAQRENMLPLKSSSAATDTIRVVKDNQSSLMLRSVLQSAIYDSIATHTDTLQALRADIDAGGSSQLMDSINVHRSELNDLHDSIDIHRTGLDDHTDSIAVHRTELNNLTDSIADHRTDIDANATQIATNSSNISANSVFISVNGNDISDLQDSIIKHTDTLQLHQDQIAALNFDNDSSWYAIQTDSISEYTASNGVYVEGSRFLDNYLTIPVTGRLRYGDADTYISEVSDDNLQFYVAGGSTLNMQGSLSIFGGTVSPITTSSTDLGDITRYWQNLYVNNVYYESTGTSITRDGSNNLSFTDAVTGTKTLAELVAAGTNYWQRSGTKVSLLNANDSVLINTGEAIIFGDGTAALYESGPGNGISVDADDVQGIFRFNGTVNTSYVPLRIDSIYEATTSHGVFIEEVEIDGTKVYGDIWFGDDNDRLTGLGATNSVAMVINGYTQQTWTTDSTVINYLAPGGINGQIGYNSVSNGYYSDLYIDNIWIDDDATYINNSSGNMRFTDTNAGSVTLSELVGDQVATYTIDYTDCGSTVTLITLPADVVIWEIWYEETTAFTGGGSDTFLNTGKGGTSQYYNADGINITTFPGTGGTVLYNGVGNQNLPDRMTGSTNITATLSGGTATAGEGVYYIKYRQL